MVLPFYMIGWLALPLGCLIFQYSDCQGLSGSSYSGKLN